MYEPQPNYTTQPNYAAPAHVIGDRRQVDWRLMGAYIIAALGVGCAVVCLWLLTSFKQVYAAQMTKVNHAVTSVQTAQSKDAKNIKNLGQEYDGMTSIVSAITAYNMTCEQYLTGPSGGPTTFWLPCTDQKPGS